VASLHLIAAILLYDGRQHEETLHMMQIEGTFPRLVELIAEWGTKDEQLHRLLLDLLYEMSRIQRLTWEDLCMLLEFLSVHDTPLTMRKSLCQRCLCPLPLCHNRITLLRRV